MRRAPLIFGIVSTVLGVVFAILGFTMLSAESMLRPSYLQVGGVTMILGGLVIAIQGAVAKTP